MTRNYDISSPGGVCCCCGKEFSPGEKFVAALKEVQEDLRREDFCNRCWEGKGKQSRRELLGVWRTQIPRPQEKKKLFVDDELLVNFFQRLDGTQEPAKINFRFVLTLVLMRRKLLVYERTEKSAEGEDHWTMRLKGTGQIYTVVDPHLDEEKIAEVSHHLGQILEADL